MADWMVWTLAIPLIVIGAALSITAIVLLITLRRIILILGDIEDKLHAFNPLCRLFYRLGRGVEEMDEGVRGRSCELIELILSGIAFLRKWRRK